MLKIKIKFSKSTPNQQIKYPWHTYRSSCKRQVWSRHKQTCSNLTINTSYPTVPSAIRQMFYQFVIFCYFRSTHLRNSVKKGVLKNFANFLGKHLEAWGPATLLRRDSSTGAFLWTLKSFSELSFWRTSTNDCFYDLFHAPSDEWNKKSEKRGKYLSILHEANVW